MLRSYIGDRAFYRRVIAVALPILIQNGIMNFVSLLDNIMVGQVGTLQMSGVAIVNQLLFVYNLCVFGATSGAGIFTAQFFGKQDMDGVRHTFRFKVLSGIAITVLCIAVFSLLGTPFIRFYLQGEGDPADAAGILHYGLQYMLVMLWGLPAFAMQNAYSSTLRESGQTVVPMVSSVISVLINLVLNWVLIFGHFGFAPMGVAGAALATVIARYVDLAIVAVWTHWNRRQMVFIQGA
ncbi:MAG: polysaccharide biosynthesis C-terminal domain-containing protein, partial [Oscillospiraceae bacterium]|nr:polysaccharide biosynthesis C-terminal domain-containing protein [Oscillospiraceae bacterium]